MKRRIALLLVLALTLSCALVLTACGKCDEHVDADIDEICDVCGEAVPFTPEYLGFEGYYQTNPDREYSNAALEAATKVLVRASYATPSVSGNLLYVSDSTVEEGTKKFVVVNLDTGKEVYSINKEKDDAEYFTTATFDTINGNTVILETTRHFSDPLNVSYTTTLYTALGVEMASVKRTRALSASEICYSIGADLVKIEDKLYTFEDDVLTEKMTLGLIDIPNVDAKTDKYYYNVEYDEYANIYDTNFKLVARYEVPSDIDDAVINVLADGNLIIQLYDELPATATEFDFMSDEVTSDDGYVAKYDLTTIIYNVEEKTETEIEFAYMIEGVINEAVYGDYYAEMFNAEKLENVAMLYPIVDKVIDYNEDMYVSLRSKDAKILGFLAQEVYEQEGLASLVAENRYTVRDKAGNRYLLNEKGEVLGEVSSTYQISAANDAMFITDNAGKYYDMDLKLVADNRNVDYSNISGGLYVDSYTVHDLDSDSDETRYAYYAKYNNVYTKLTLPAKYSESTSGISAGGNYIRYTERVEGEGTTPTKNYIVFLNLKGETIFKVQTDSSTVEGVTTTKSVNHNYSNGVLVIAVTTNVTNAEGTTTTVEYHVAQ